MTDDIQHLLREGHVWKAHEAFATQGTPLVSYATLLSFLEKTSSKETAHTEALKKDTNMMALRQGQHLYFLKRCEIALAIVQHADFSFPEGGRWIAQFLQTVGREHFYAGMGDVASYPENEEDIFKQVVRRALKSAGNLSDLHFSDDDLKNTFFYVIHDLLSSLCDAGFYDRALRRNPEETIESLLQQNNEERALSFYEGIGGNHLLRRAVEIGVIERKHFVQSAFHLGQMGYETEGVTEFLMERGVRFPRTETKEGVMLFKTGGRQTTYSPSQLESWWKWDPDAFFLPMDTNAHMTYGAYVLQGHSLFAHGDGDNKQQTLDNLRNAMDAYWHKKELQKHVPELPSKQKMGRII